MKRILLVIAFCFGMVAVFAQDAAEKINQANEAMKAKDYAKAFALYDDAMANLGDVQVPDAINYNIGLAAYNSKKYDKAVAYFDKAISADVNKSKSFDYKARSFSRMKKYAEAVASYKKAIEATDGDTKALVYNSGIAAYQGGLNEKAIEAFSKSVEAGYKGANAQFYKAAVYKKMNDTDAYKAALEEGATKFAGDKKISKALSKVYFTEGYDLYKKGAAVIKSANEKVSAGSMTTADDAYKAEVEKGKESFAAAVTVLEKAKALDASNANIGNVLKACKESL